MKISIDELDTHLQKKLASIFLVCGDETFIVDEAINDIKAAALSNGFNEIKRFTTESHFSWDHFNNELFCYSLFNKKKVIQLNLVSKLDAIGLKLLNDYCLAPDHDILLLIKSSKLDAKAQQSSWVQAINKHQIFLPVWPIETRSMPQWIKKRLDKFNLRFSHEALSFFIDQFAGNLFAAAQEIEKLALLNLNETISLNTLQAIISNNAHFDIFAFVDTLFLGNSRLALQILQNLQAEGVDPILIIWAVTRELRLACVLAEKIKQGNKLSALFQQYKIFLKRQPSFQKFLNRHGIQETWQLLTYAATIDQIIKGMLAGNVWQELANLSLKISFPTLPPAGSN